MRTTSDTSEEPACHGTCKRQHLGVHRKETVPESEQGEGRNRPNSRQEIPWVYFLLKGDLKCGLCLHKRSQSKFLQIIKSLTSRSNGKGYAWLKAHLTRYIRGWLTYYRHADMKSFIISANKWYNRRLRMYIWKSWKRVRMRIASLLKCGVSRWKALRWANTRKGYWRIAGSAVLTSTITNERLMQAGYPSISRLYDKSHRG